MPYVYVLCSRSDTWPSKIIYRFSPGEFTHVALATERDLRELYSFGRLYDRLPLPELDLGHEGPLGTSDSAAQLPVLVQKESVWPTAVL